MRDPRRSARPRALALTLLVGALTLVTPRTSSAANPEGPRRALHWLETHERERLREVGPLEVTPQPIREHSFALDLDATCAKAIAWSRGTPRDPAQIRALLAQASIAERVEIASDDPVAIAKLARDLSDLLASAHAICEQVLATTPSPGQIELLRAGHAGELGEALAQLLQVHDKAKAELIKLLDKIAPFTTDEQLVANVSVYADAANQFIARAETELAGKRASALSVGSLGAAAQRTFDGLAGFLIDRAEQEAIAYLREQLVDQVCADDADPIVFVPTTCRLLEQIDPNMSLSAIGASLRTALLTDLELLPDRALVLAWMIEPETAYVGTSARVLIPLVRDAVDRGDPLEYAASLYAAPALDCERLAGPGHETGDERCADTMAVLRLSSLLIRAVATSSPDKRNIEQAYLGLAVGFAIEAEFDAMPIEARTRILAALDRAELRVDATMLAALADVVADAEQGILDLQAAITTLQDQVAGGEREVVDEDLLRLARVTTNLLSALGRDSVGLFATLRTNPETNPAAEPPAWHAGVDAALLRLPKLFGLAQAHATDDWSQALIDTLGLLDQLLAGHGEGSSVSRFSTKFQSINRYIPLIIEIANAKSSDEVNKALQAAFPIGGYKRKFHEPALSINGFLGIYGGGTVSNTLTSDDQLSFGQLGGEFSLFAPIGLELTGPVGARRKRPSHLGLLVSVIDLGSITTSKWLEQQTNPEVTTANGTSQTSLGEPAAFNLAGLVAPGAYFTVGIASSPFSFGVGASLNPFAHKLTTTGRDSVGDIESLDATYLPALRFGAFLAVDITFVSFALR